MASGHLGAAFRQVGRLFSVGSVSGFSEAQLLSRFLQQRDESAFEALVHRFGPMVLGVCRHSLNDSHAVDDAFQATFLVLVRRGHTIRDPALLGNWLYGVAVKVAKRARADAHKRSARERGGVELMADSVGDLHEFHDPDLGPLLHEELARLPQKYRAPIVLCFLEGRTHEEAAELLQWPVGTVKGRMARAKDLLRERLSRRGVTASTVVLAGALSQTARASVPTVLLDQTVKAAMGIAAGGAVAAGLSSAGAYALSDGVITTMAVTKMKLAAAGVVAVAISATGATVYASLSGLGFSQNSRTETSQPADPPGNPKSIATNEASDPNSESQQVPDFGKDPLRELLGDEPAVGQLPPLEELAKRRIDAAKQRLDAQAAYYQNGTVTIDRYLEAAHRFMLARMEGSTDPAERLSAAEDNVRLMRVLLKSEEAKFQAGSGALPNVAEAAANLADAEVELYKLRNSTAPVTTRSQGAIQENAADLAENEKIAEALSQRISFPFAHETPLGDVIKFIRNATTSERLQSGIPIYVDPNGLLESEKTIDSPVTLSVENLKVGTGLRLVLKQLDLGYFVREGLLTITSLQSEDYKDVTDPEWREREAEEMEKARNQNPGGGGFGGVGVGSGS